MQEGDLERALMEAEKRGREALERILGKRARYAQLILRLDSSSGAVSLTVDVHAPISEEEADKVIEEVFRGFEEAYNDYKSRSEAVPGEIQRADL